MIRVKLDNSFSTVQNALIMDIIRNATGMNVEKVKNHRKKAMLANNTEKKRNSGKTKSKVGSVLHVQERNDIFSQSHSRYPQKTIGLTSQNGMLQNVTQTHATSSRIIGNGVSYNQTGGENQGNARQSTTRVVH